MNVFDEVNRLCNQWERKAGPLPPDACHLLRKLVRTIVLQAAAVCRGRSLGRAMVVAQEAKKCADQVAHELLCNEGERICYHCDGYGCPGCGQRGIVVERTGKLRGDDHDGH